MRHALRAPAENRDSSTAHSYRRWSMRAQTCDSNTLGTALGDSADDSVFWAALSSLVYSLRLSLWLPPSPA